MLNVPHYFVLFKIGPGFTECKHLSKIYFDFHFCKEQGFKGKHWKHFSVHMTHTHTLLSVKLELGWLSILYNAGPRIANYESKSKRTRERTPSTINEREAGFGSRC